MNPKTKAEIAHLRFLSMKTNSRASNIKVSKALKSFSGFVDWAWDLITEPDMILTRHDKDEGYSRGNCYFRVGKHEDLAGKAFGGYFVTERGSNDASGNTRWKCFCLTCKDKFIFQSNYIKKQKDCCRKCRKSTEK